MAIPLPKWLTPLRVAVWFGTSPQKVWALTKSTKRWLRKTSLALSILATAKWAWKTASCLLTNWCIWVLPKRRCQAYPLVWKICSFHLPKTKSSKRLMQKFVWLKASLNKVSWPRVNAITKSLIFGHVPMTKSPKPWWITYHKIPLSTAKVKRKKKNRLTRFISCRIQGRVVVPHRFVSWRVCVVWWQNQTDLLLKPQLKPTSVKA